MDVTLVVVGMYFAALVIFGIFVSKSRASGDFATAKKSLGVIAIAAGLVMTHYGGGFILGGAELAYLYGWYGIAYGLAASLGVLFLGIFLSKKMVLNTRGKIKTIPTFLMKKFGDKKIFYIATLLSIIALIAIASAQLFAAMKIFSSLSIPIRISSALTMIIVCLIAMKGMSALTKSGKFNLIIASIGAIFAICLAFSFSPNEGLTQSFTKMPIQNFLWILLPTIMYTLIGQDFHQKIYSAKSPQTAKYACILASLILFFLSFFPVIIGMGSRSLFTIEASEAMPQFILYAMPSIIKGFFIAAILAAVIGSAQSVINAAATQISEDIFGQIKMKSKRIKNIIAPMSAITISLIAFVLTLFSSGIVNNIILAYTFYTASMFVPVVAAFTMKKNRIPAKQIFIVAIVGLAISVILESGLIKTSIPSIVISVLISIALFFIIRFNKIVVIFKR